MLRTAALAALVGALGVTACDSSSPAEPLAPSTAAATAPVLRAAAAGASVRVLATGLRFPRGFTFGGGSIYVAEAGSGGTNGTRASRCDQVVPPVGPYTNARTARISRIGPNGNRSTVASGFPSGVNQFGDVVGVADVAFVGDQLVALVAGGGCSHGSGAFPAGVAKVSRSGDWSIVADLSAFQAAHPVAHPFAGDFEPDGTWYSMLHVHGLLFAVEPNHGEVVRIDPTTWAVRRVVDVSASQGHIVPTALAERSGNLFFSQLGTFPVQPGSQKVFSLRQNGDLSVAADGFTAVLGLDFDARGRMYVLETSHAAGSPTPGTGRVVRVNGDGTHDVIVDGLFFPTAMRFGPDGKLYISNKGFGPPQPGELLQVDVPGAGAAALAAAPAAFVASAAATRTDIPFFEQFDDVNPCSGLPNTVTISGTVRVIDQDGREVLHAEREISTSDGFAGRGTSTDVINGRNEMFRLSDMVTNESGARYRVQFRIVVDLTTGEVRTIREAPTLTCLRS